MRKNDFSQSQIQEMRDNLAHNINLINLKNDTNQTKKSLMHTIMTKFAYHNLPFIVLLASKDLLRMLFAKVSQKQKQLDQSTKKQIQKELAKIILIANKESPRFMKCFCSQYYNQILRIQSSYNQEELLKNINYNVPKVQYFKMLQQFITAKLNNKQYLKDFQSIHSALQSIHLFQNWANINQIYEQISVNCFKKEIDILRKSSQILCCRSFFCYDDLIDSKNQEIYTLRKFPLSQIKSRCQNFMQTKYRQVQQNQKFSFEKLQLSRAVRNLMNKIGGAILLGFEQISPKKWKLKGFQADQKGILATLNYIKQALNLVQVKHGGFQTEVTKQVEISLRYILNNYVTVEFIRIANRNTFTYQNKKLYIIRLLIKQGHPRFIYYVFNGQIQFKNEQNREEQQNKMQSIQDFYEIIYKKLNDFQNMKISQGLKRQKLHEGCRMQMSLNHSQLDIDIGNEY